MLLGQLVQEDGTQIDIEDVEKLHDPQTARTKDHVEKLFIEKERNVIGIATEVVGDGRLLKKIKSSLKNNRSISTDKELRTNHHHKLTNNGSNQETFFMLGQPNIGFL